MVRKVRLSAIFLATILAAFPTTLFPIQSQTEESSRRDRQLKAIAFLLGWDSKLVLVEKKASRRQHYLSDINSRLRQLGLSLPHPVSYYFQYPVRDEGARAQAFTEDVMSLLKRKDPDIANHFGVAHNILLSIRRAEVPVATRREEIEELVQFLDIPADLQQKPEEDLVTWVDDIHEYFVATASGRVMKGRLSMAHHV